MQQHADGSGGSTRGARTARDRRGGRRGALVTAVAAAGLLACAGAQAMQGGSGPNSQSQAYFVCLPSEQAICGDPYNEAFTTTPIDDIKLGGGYWDVTWSQTAPATSPFVLSTTTAKPGQPLTGIDAANALVAFYDRIPMPVGYPYADTGEIAITAFSPGAASFPLGEAPSTPGDVAVPFPGYGARALYTPKLASQMQGINIGYSDVGEYTIWTPVAAPTHVPELTGTGLGGAAAMLAFGIALLRGRRRAVAGAALVGALSVGGAQAQVLMCGASACADPFTSAFGACGSGQGCGIGATGIDDLKLGGGYWDVAYTDTEPATSPFVFSHGTAKPGQPLTGIDAALAIDKFYGTFNPLPGDYPYAGDPGPTFITAWKPTKSEQSGFLYDAADSADGGGGPGITVILPWAESNEGQELVYTKWTPVAPPAHAPELDATGVGGAATLLAGLLAWVRGRRATG